MKQIIVLFVFIISLSCSGQKEINTATFSQKMQNTKKTQLVLNKVIADSRCPEGVSCIWAGEVEIIVSVYENKQPIKNHTLRLSSKLKKENLAWFSAYYPDKEISEIALLPYPKNGVKTAPEDYFVKITFSK